MKERVTGAIILVALMVLLVPELLTGPIRTGSAPRTTATAASWPAGAGRRAHAQPPLRTYTMTLGSGSSAPDTPAAQAQPAESSRESPAQAPAESAPAMPAGTSAEALPGSRASQPGAAAERAAPRASGLQAATPPAHSVLREASSSASSRGWVVQLGSFADRHNAVRLAHSLEARGFRMSVSPARAGSRVLWRVRAGPAHNRAGALHLATRLRALGHRGEVLPTR